MRTNGKVTVGVAACVAIVISALVLYRTRPSVGIAARAEQREFEEAMIAQGQVAYAPLDSIECSELTSAAPFRAALANAFVQPVPPPGAGQLSDLLDHVADFVFNVFCAESPAAYRSWRAAHGYTMTPLQEMVDLFDVDDIHLSALGTLIATTDDAASVFDRFWENDSGSKVLAGKVTRIVIDRRGMIVCGGRRSRAAPSPIPFRGDESAGGLSEAAWNGAHGSGVITWFYSREMCEQRLLLSEESVLYTDVGLIVEFQGGYRLPIRVACSWNPHANVWSIENLVLLGLPLRVDAMSTKAF